MTQAYPLQWPAGWPRARSRKKGRFNTTERKEIAGGGAYRSAREISIYEAIQRILYELERLGVPAGEAIISTNLKTRLDGLPRSDQAAPQDPGAAVYWRRREAEATKVMGIDLYDRVADNLAAIAATLEAMRAIERHGGAQILERAFTGFDALPNPEREDPLTVLGLWPGATRDAIETSFRALAKRHHPDHGGNPAEFHRIQRARELALERATA